MPRPFILAAALAALLLAAGCTTIVAPPAPSGSGGPPLPLRVCLLKDRNLSCERAEAVMAAVTREMARHGIAVSVPWVREWQRPGFFEADISRAVAAYPLEAPCDRILALVGRNFKDFAWGLLMPEIFGAVETRSHTKGYAVAEVGSLNQVLTFHSPAGGALHELYHMLGCEHGAGDACGARIAALKARAPGGSEQEEDFLPGLDPRGRPLTTRAAVNAAFADLAPPEAPDFDLAVLGAPAAVCAPVN